MAFNIIGRNQDDHVKNIAFLMDQSGTWSLSPAFDMTYSYNPSGAWTGTHQMSLNGKRDDFELDDFKACAKNSSMKRGRAEEILQQVHSAILKWKEFASEAGVPDKDANSIARTHRTSILG
jgi:serine/threonine-protein kinase HipA